MDIPIVRTFQQFSLLATRRNESQDHLCVFRGRLPLGQQVDFVEGIDNRKHARIRSTRIRKTNPQSPVRGASHCPTEIGGHALDPWYRKTSRNCRSPSAAAEPCSRDRMTPCQVRGRGPLLTATLKVSAGYISAKPIGCLSSIGCSSRTTVLGCCTQALRIDKHSSVRQSASDGYSKARRRMSKTIFFLKRLDCLFQEARLKKSRYQADRSQSG